MNIIHMSDPHIRVTPMEPTSDLPIEMLIDDGEKLRIALRKAMDQAEIPELFLFTGDLVHEGPVEDYRFLKSLLEDELNGIPYYVALGNHDCHTAFYDGFLNQPGKDGPFFYSATHNGLRIICLDTNPTDYPPIGELTEEQLIFLKNELSISAPNGSIIVMHHPAECVYERYSAHMVKNSKKFLEIVSGSDIRMVLSGHTHYFSYFTAAKTLFATAASTAFGIDASGINVRFTGSSAFHTIRMTEDAAYTGQIELGRSNHVLFDA
jgi:3',5'-cyclic AMP phosphodiesterase CpdA